MNLFGRALADGDRLEVAGTVVVLKVHSRARRVSLRLDRRRGEVIATAPSARRLPEAAAFARERAAWIAERLAEQPDRLDLVPGAVIEVGGRPCLLVSGRGRPRWEAGEAGGPDKLIAPGEGGAFARAALRGLNARALDVLSERTAAHCATLGKPLPRIGVMDARTRWGSCSPGRAGQGASIRYSWRLVLAPLSVADYVAAHECAHLVELNHSPRFWAVAERLVGPAAPHRAWLRTHAARLHAVGQGL